MSEDTKQLESLSYKPAKSSPATLGFNSVVIRPEMKVNKAEGAEHPLEAYKSPKCALPDDNGGVLANPEHPNQNLIIIGDIEGLISQVNKKLGKIRESTYFAPVTKMATVVSQALEEVDKFQKTTLYDLRKEFE